MIDGILWSLSDGGRSSLKWFRRVATRYEKLAIHYLALVTLAIIFHLL